MTWPFGDLPMFGFRVILADPPWAFENYSAAGEGRNAKRHYPTMTPAEIAALPVGHLAQRDCALFLWVTDPLLDRGIEVLRAWGFRYATVAFTWAKRTKTDAAWHLGTGYYTRANPEMCLLGIAGRMGLPDTRFVRQLIVEPIREHSRKPDRVRTDIETLYAGPYLELFARSSRKGWSRWGNEAGKFGEAGR